MVKGSEIHYSFVIIKTCGMTIMLWNLLWNKIFFSIRQDVKTHFVKLQIYHILSF